MSASSAILEVRNLRTSYFSGDGEIPVVDDVSFQVERGKTLGIVGESGSGKTVAAMSILQLIAPPGRVVGGQVLFNRSRSPHSDRPRDAGSSRIANCDGVSGADDGFESCARRWHPDRRGVLAHPEVSKISKREARDRAVQAMRDVGIPDPETRARDYPHQLSGGMRQRVMIAMALVCRPELLIADEPTTALDVTIQAQILELLSNLQARLGLSMILISHDLGVIAEVAQTVAVMCKGKIVETGAVMDIFRTARPSLHQRIARGSSTTGFEQDREKH